MNSLEASYLGAVECHEVEEIRALLDAGLSPQTRFKGLSLVTCLTEMYSRSDRFVDCLRLLLDRGAVADDPAVVPVLLNDADALRSALQADPSLIRHRTDMISTFTPLVGATLLHVAAEYGHCEAARVLIEMGAEVDARAAVDDFGMNGHTPLFHTVNSNANRSEPLMRLLLAAGANTDVRLAGITWGKGFEWETTCFDVTPLSYCQMGLLRQFQRREKDTYANIKLLLAAGKRIVPPLENIPNRYLYPDGKT
ncbi:MAG TPA: ankyrin repeat domain-containing protein [Candidatus Limnocylindria bacterium]|jgi:ankyrin repeat protein|nr:ankyrin repeat domain-containing protein [Candidatus Limnocylindria bacterium]